KWEEINELLQKVKGLKNYIWILIITISLILFFIKQGYEVGIILSGFAILLNIFLLVFQLINKSK
ncbi:MAG: hypothetical protein KAQ92_07035, partial [Candidatus Aenigmarchaeota archaeon]|nr:hypothetical protein [Candidatus Aenigmarchaeota archaeon]